MKMRVLREGGQVDQMQFQVESFETKGGRIPTAEFLDPLESKMNAEMVGLMKILEEKG